MDDPESIFQILQVFSKLVPKQIPIELEEYISYVARTGEPVFQWALVKTLIKEKLLAVLNEFMEGNPNLEIPPCPNVDAFNFETMKSNLLSRLDSFLLPPFTIQRICELLSAPRKEYNRLDKYMRAVEKNVLVVSASDLSMKSSDNDTVFNGIFNDKGSEVNDSLNITDRSCIYIQPIEDGDLNVSSKLDETDAVQQIIEESWINDNHNEFKINGGPSSSTLGVNFENELQFVTDKACEEKNLDVSKDDSDSSYGNNSMLLDSSLQNIIGESSAIAFDTVSKSDESFDSKNDDTYEFKSDSICESELSSTSETGGETVTFGDKSVESTSEVDDGDVSSSMAVADLSETTSESDGNQKEETNTEYKLLDMKSDDVVSDSQLEAEKDEVTNNFPSSLADSHEDASSTVEESGESAKELVDVHNTIAENVESSTESCDSSLNCDTEISAAVATHDSKNEITSTEEMEVDHAEAQFSCGDNERVQDVEGNSNVSQDNEISETSRSDETLSNTT